jgi:S1-C subfamily serine protease
MFRPISSSGFGVWLLLTSLLSSHWDARPARGEGEPGEVARKLLSTTLTVRSAEPSVAAVTAKPKSSEAQVDRLAPSAPRPDKDVKNLKSNAKDAERRDSGSAEDVAQSVSKKAQVNQRYAGQAGGVSNESRSATQLNRPAEAKAGLGAPAATEPAPPTAAPTNVTVCSGVSVGERLVVTFAQVVSPRSAAPQFRVTLPDGQQSSAELRVVDRYSGLSLVELQDGDPPSLECADKLPKVGDTVYTAAGSGIEPPIVSRGIVSGLERALTGTGLPPLLLCDVRTTETSSGAPLVNEEGELVGVVIAAGASNQMANWAYAVPAQFVKRLMTSVKPGELVVLERRRSTLGLTMGQGDKEGTVEVEHVTPEGPADQAGIRTGDRILEAEGRKIRSAYQAVDMVLSRQPGDMLDFLVEQNGRQKNVEVTLGGAVESSSMPSGASQSYFFPQVKVERDGENQLKIANGQAVVPPIANQPAPAVNRARVAAGVAKGEADGVTALREMIVGCEKSIAELRAEVSNRERKLVDNEEQLKALRQEVRELKRKVAEPAKASADSK